MTTPILAGMRATADRINDAHPRTIAYQAITANTSSATAETVWVTTGAVTFRAGRAYRMTLKALIQGNSADKATLRVRKTNASGSVYLDTFHQGIQVTSSNTLIYVSNICVNTTGADVTATALVGTFQRSSGSAASVLVAASATHVAYVQVEDIGIAADFPSATAIT
ncbi:hypothetical protein [Streptomyces sp. SID13726]|uniref:hypothetical protein n=1 Tax=Streptomyces sp. SID13726 TaxID=2706058 RepID=UPI0013B70F9D|nr:hypothetical protein [Streptomyces sp. SID13726]NEB00633.1 hypothetical protein [Streptomyces sp. SID13726]